jgi:hypothetical protein
MLMMFDSQRAIRDKKNERLEDRLKRIENDIAMLKEKVGILD